MPWWPISSKDSKKGKKPTTSGLFDGGSGHSRSPKPRAKEDNGSSKCNSPYSLDLASEAGSGSGVGSRSPSPSSPIHNSKRRHSQGQPLPLPCAPPTKSVGRAYSEVQLPNVQNQWGSLLHHAASMPLPSPAQVGLMDNGDYPSGSVSSASSLGSVEVDPRQQGRASHLRPLQEPEPPEQLRPVPQMSHVSAASRGGVLRHEPVRSENSRSTSLFPGSYPPVTSPTSRVWPPKWPSPLKISQSQPDSSKSSPVRSPRYVSQHQRNGMEPTVSGSVTGSPHSGNTSAYNSWQGDLAPLMAPQHHEDRSLSPSPRLRSPGPSRTTSAAVSPLHPRAVNRTSGGPDSPTTWSGESPVSGTSTKWQKGKLLGSGTFGNVYVGFNNDNGGFCAMKEVLLVSDDHKSKESVKQLGQEISLLSKLRHENIVQYIGTETLEDRLYIYLEYVSGGSIHKLLQEYGAFKEPVVRNYTRQILSGLAYLHNQNTVHRDIKGANILVDTNGMVKLADFGMAKHISAQSFLQSFKGSPYWMAPEVIKNTGGYDLAVDIWSLGCTVLEMLTTKPPWNQYEGVAAMFKIGNSKELPVIPNTLSRTGREFVRLCLQRDPAQRPTAAQLLEHPFVQDVPRICRPDDTVAGTDLLPNTIPAIRPVNVTSHKGQRPVTLHENDGTCPHTRGRLPHSPTSELSPRTPSALPSLNTKSPRRVHQVFSGMSTPGIMSSGSSTPPGGGYGCSPLLPHQLCGALSVYPNEGYVNSSRTQSGRYASPSVINGGVYPEPRKDSHWNTPSQRTPDGSPRRKNHFNRDNNILDFTAGRVALEDDHQMQYHGNGTSREHLTQHLHHRPGSSHQSAPILSRTLSHEFARQWQP
ncbi:mitogen-activated protein kinase kinase kinase YODA isoform X2 [Physcomitrium patens]|uniref:mitogen-activated protein kinase kinase kinase YODA isoform X2 n=1 Tax=Physcomitrium patens TaxID=3218 RepID=UPI000D17BBC2|nr:mitogen-activated protein kinase kinase kinase 3-like isoform X2 [Physcomitrium patens]|eukprot:XP_024358117.1 mitogen-activated protein kinase kinase kinase 3-like isoform X2 [Physcomitrella patens]